MRWEDERYVRLYKRDTADWLALSFDAQGLFCLLLRKVDLSGCLELGRHGTKAVAAVINQVALWDPRLKLALDELVTDGCVRIEGETLVVPNYVAAQEATASPKLRQRIKREREEAGHAEEPTVTDPTADATNGHASRDNRDHESLNVTSVTKRDASVTANGELSRAVTPAKPAKPSVPSVPAEPDRARAREAWPSKILSELRRTLGRKLTETSDRPWQEFVVESLEYPLADRLAAVREYQRRGYAPGEHPPSYLLAIIRGESTKSSQLTNGRDEDDAPPDDGNYRSPEATKKLLDEQCPPAGPRLSSEEVMKRLTPGLDGKRIP